MVMPLSQALGDASIHRRYSDVLSVDKTPITI